MRVRRLLSLVRAPIWWAPKVLPVIAAAALAAIAARVPAGEGIPRIVAMVLSATGVAAFAHLVNDLSDREADRRAGKRNAVSAAPRRTPWVMVVATAALWVAPWLVVPIGVPAAITLVVLVLTSVAYSAPPLRLKRRGFVGVLADAAVAHVLPTTFAFVLMGSAGTRTASWWWAMASAICWAWGFGVRSIVVHQILDVDGDRRAGVATFVVRRGVHRAARTGRDAVALELAGLAGLAVASIWVAWGAAVFFAVHVALWLHHRRWERPPIDMVPLRVGQWLPLAEFYEVWPAVAFCAVLAVADPWWALLLVGIVVVFWSAVEKQLFDELSLFAEVFAVWAEHLAGWAATAAGVAADWSNRVYHRVRVALRELRFAFGRAWWAVYRFHWRVRHFFGPVVLFVRRQRRRARRHLRGNGSHSGHA